MYTSGSLLRTNAFSTYRTHFQEPSLVSICKAAIGWLYKIVTVPMSILMDKTNKYKGADTHYWTLTRMSL